MIKHPFLHPELIIPCEKVSSLLLSIPLLLIFPFAENRVTEISPIFSCWKRMSVVGGEICQPKFSRRPTKRVI